MRTILVNAESYTTAIRLIPVIKALEISGRYNVITYSSLACAGGTEKAKILSKLFEESGIQLKTNSDFGLEQYQTEISKEQKDYLSRFKQCISDDSLHQKTNYKGVPLLKYVSDQIVEWNTIKICYIMWFEKILEACMPGLVINAYDIGGIKKYFVTAAQKVNIPTLTLQYAAFYSYRTTKKNSDYFCIWGEYYRDVYLRAGAPTDRVYATGNPALDNYLHGSFDRDALLRHLGLDPDKKTVIISIVVMDLIKMIKYLLNNAENLNDIQFVFKLHPDVPEKDRRKYEEVLSQHKLPIIMLQDGPISALALLKASDIMIYGQDSGSCTYTLEAFALGLEIILLFDQPMYFPLFEFEEDKYCHIAWNEVEVMEHLKSILSRKCLYSTEHNAKEYREKLWHKLDGKATGRVIGIIDNIVN